MVPMPSDIDSEFRLTLDMAVSNAPIKGVKKLEGTERKMLVDHLIEKIRRSNWVISRGEVTSGFYIDHDAKKTRAGACEDKI